MSHGRSISKARRDTLKKARRKKRQDRAAQKEARTKSASDWGDWVVKPDLEIKRLPQETRKTCLAACVEMLFRAFNVPGKETQRELYRLVWDAEIRKPSEVKAAELLNARGLVAVHWGTNTTIDELKRACGIGAAICTVADPADPEDKTHAVIVRGFKERSVVMINPLSGARAGPLRSGDVALPVFERWWYREGRRFPKNAILVSKPSPSAAGMDNDSAAEPAAEPGLASGS
jgi:hypothetical protein